MIIVLSVLGYIICGILFGAIIQYCDRNLGLSTDEDLMIAICTCWPISLIISIFYVVTSICVDISRAIANWLYTKFHKKT
jgi:hypothetical protein